MRQVLATEKCRAQTSYGGGGLYSGVTENIRASLQIQIQWVIGYRTNRLTNTFTKDFCVRITNTFKKDSLCLDNEHILGGDQGYTPEIMHEILTTATDLELEVNEDDIEELIMGHEDELTTKELQEILNEEHQETQRNVSPEQEEDEREPMPTSDIKVFLKKWVDVRAMKGCGSPVVKVSNHGRHVMSSIQVPLKTRRVGQRCTLNLSRAETSLPLVWCGS
ncbi:hypothetical protein TNCV_1170871 [Trichonephila clavipes]|nr:hypothetical protein TNCV_1170871 [Trichonephila clavipes]